MKWLCLLSLTSINKKINATIDAGFVFI